MVFRTSALPVATKGGFTLLEVMLAVMIFAIAVLGLISALHTSVEAANSFNREVAIAVSLQNQLAEIEYGEFPEPGTENYGPDEIGVHYTRVIEPLRLHNRHGRALNRMYKVQITAAWGSEEEPESQTVEVYVYRP